MRFEIIGNIASGKTTLAELFGKSAIVVFENFRQNPFWEAFYKDPLRNSFETEITFTLQHYHQIKEAFVTKNTPAITDFSLWLDAAYAKVTLSSKRLELYNLVHQELIAEVGTPDLLIKLECGVEELRQRIKARNRSQEAGISIDYLKDIEREINRQVVSLSEIGVPIHVIDSQKYDFAHKGSDIETVLTNFKKTQTQRD